MQKDIIVIGGYGKVGNSICHHLKINFNQNVYIAGRSIDRAESLSAELGHPFIPLKFDIENEEDWLILDEKKLIIVVCIDQKDTRFLEYCLKTSCDYVDVTASTDYIMQLYQLKEQPFDYKSKVIIGVGLAPGLTNLMVKDNYDKLKDTNSVNIYIQLGLGEEHGIAAIEWTVGHINEIYSIVYDQKVNQVESFVLPKSHHYFGEKRSRKNYPMNFVDQHIVAKAYKPDSVLTYICFESKVFTWMIGLLKQLGVFKLVRYKLFRKLVVKAIDRLKFGTEVFKIEVVNGNQLDQKQSTSIIGYGEGDITGHIAAITVNLMTTKADVFGVFHLDELFNLDEFLPELDVSFNSDVKINC